MDKEIMNLGIKEYDIDNINTDEYYINDYSFQSKQKAFKLIHNYTNNYNQFDFITKLKAFSFKKYRLYLFFEKETNFINLREYLKNHYLDHKERVLLVVKLCNFLAENLNSLNIYPCLFLLKITNILYNEETDSFKLLWPGIDNCYINITYNFDSIVENCKEEIILLPPELSKMKYRDSNKLFLDMFCLGCIMYFIIYGDGLNEMSRKSFLSLSNKNSNINLRSSINLSFNMSFNSSIEMSDNALIDIICKCLNDNPSMRYDSWKKLNEDIVGYYQSKYTEWMCSNCFNDIKFWCSDCDQLYCYICIKKGVCPKGHSVILNYEELYRIKTDLIHELRSKNFKPKNYMSNENKELDELENYKTKVNNLFNTFLEVFKKIFDNLKNIEKSLYNVNCFSNEYEHNIFEKIKYQLDLENEENINLEEKQKESFQIQDKLDKESNIFNLNHNAFNKLIEKQRKLNQLNDELDIYLISSESITKLRASFENKLKEYVGRSSDYLKKISDHLSDNLISSNKFLEVVCDTVKDVKQSIGGYEYLNPKKDLKNILQVIPIKLEKCHINQGKIEETQSQFTSFKHYESLNYEDYISESN